MSLKNNIYLFASIWIIVFLYPNQAKGEEICIKEFQEVKNNPANSSSHFNKAICLFDSGKVNKSVLSFKKSIELNRGNLGAYYFLGLAYTDTLNKHNKAIDTINDAFLNISSFQTISDGPAEYLGEGTSGLYFVRGIARFRLEQYEKAYWDFSKGNCYIEKSCNMLSAGNSSVMRGWNIYKQNFYEKKKCDVYCKNQVCEDWNWGIKNGSKLADPCKFVGRGLTLQHKDPYLWPWEYMDESDINWSFPKQRNK